MKVDQRCKKSENANAKRIPSQGPWFLVLKVSNAIFEKVEWKAMLSKSGNGTASRVPFCERARRLKKRSLIQFNHEGHEFLIPLIKFSSTSPVMSSAFLVWT